MSKAWPVEGIKPGRSLGDASRRILAVRVAEVYSYRPIVHQPEAVEETHALRISLKRLRYSLELFASVFGEPGERQIERVKTLQEVLGDLHDIDVRLDLIHAAVEREQHTSPPAPDRDVVLGGLHRLSMRERELRDATHDQFVERWNTAQQAGMRADLVRLSRLGHPV